MAPAPLLKVPAAQAAQLALPIVPLAFPGVQYAHVPGAVGEEGAEPRGQNVAGTHAVALGRVKSPHGKHAVLAAVLVKKPAAALQGTHAVAPEAAELVAVPAAQGEHTLEPGGAVYPGAQGTQVALEVAPKVPLAVPAGHAVPCVVAPTSLDQYPGPTSLHPSPGGAH